MKDSRDMIAKYLLTEKKVIEGLDISKINVVFNVLDDCLKSGRTVYVFGNGGSGATASHMTNDFNKALFKETEMTFKFNCLNDNMPTMLAIANDEGYDEVFLYQLIGRITSQDVVIAFSGSGNSKNVLNAVEYAKECGTQVIGFTGFDGGKLMKLADYNLHINIDNMQITEDVHLMIEHLLISMFYETYGIRKYEKMF